MKPKKERTETTNYSIAIFDENPVVVDAIKMYLKNHREYVKVLFGHDRNVKFKTLNEEINPDFIITEILFKEEIGIDFVVQLMKKYPKSSIIVFSNLMNKTRVKNLVDLGIMGYVSKNESLSFLFTVIDQIHALNKPYFPIEFLSQKEENEKRKLIVLNDREREILELIIEGKQNKEIADIIYLSVNTVNYHRKNLYRKFGINSIAELVREAIDLGYYQSK